jgi:hypothetical protein
MSWCWRPASRGCLAHCLVFTHQSYPRPPSLPTLHPNVREPINPAERDVWYTSLSKGFNQGECNPPS